MTKYTFFSFSVKIASFSKIDMLLVQESTSLYFLMFVTILMFPAVTHCDSRLPISVLQWFLLKEPHNMTREIVFPLNYVKVFRGRFN